MWAVQDVVFHAFVLPGNGQQMALLELYKSGEADWEQRESFGEITVRARSQHAPGTPVFPLSAREYAEGLLTHDDALIAQSRFGEFLAALDASLVATTGRYDLMAELVSREKEELGDSATAVHQYCRYLALAPDAGDAKQVSDRITKLLPAQVLRRADAVATAFQSGLGHYDARDWSGAEEAFTTAMTADSALPAPVFDRALAKENAQDNAGAIRDFSRYLALDPNAIDADSVRLKIEVYRRTAPSAGKAIAFGILPGGGQFYTGQPILGAGVLAAAGAGIALALQSTLVNGVVTKTY